MQYNKDKNKPKFMFRRQKKNYCYLTARKIESNSKDANTSWGVHLEHNYFEKFRLIKPSITGISQPQYTLWMMTEKEKYAGRKVESYLKFQEMLEKNEITMVLTMRLQWC